MCTPSSLQQTPIQPESIGDYYQIQSGSLTNCSLQWRDGSSGLTMTCSYENVNDFADGTDYEFVSAVTKNQQRIEFGETTNCTGSEVEYLKHIQHTN